MMVTIDKQALDELKAGYSKRVANFKREGKDCITLCYQEYKRLEHYASIGLELSKLDQDDREGMTLSDLIMEIKGE